MGLSRLFLMPDGQDRYNIAFNPVSGHIAAVAEVDKPFSECFGKILNRSSKAGMRTQDRHPLPDRCTRPLRDLRAFRPQEFTQPLQIPDRLRGEDHLWHSGAGSSSSVPQLASHRSTSSAVACRPVS